MRASTPCDVLSGVPQGSVLELFLDHTCTRLSSSTAISDMMVAYHRCSFTDSKALQHDLQTLEL